MSEQEQHAVVGRMVTDYVQARRELASVNSKANEYSQTLKRIAELLAPVTDQQQIRDFNGRRWTDAVEQFPSKEELVHVAEEIMTLTKRKDSLRQSLREIGFEPKD